MKLRNKPLSEDTITFLKMMLIIIPLIALGIARNLSAEELIEGETAGWGFRVTWVCPNKNCGYENGDLATHCGICGTWRYAKPCSMIVPKEKVDSDMYVKRIFYRNHYYLIFNEKAVLHDPECVCGDAWQLIEQDDGYLMVRHRPWEHD